MKITEQSEIAESELKASKRLHPEDIVIGDEVAVSEVGYQCASFMWCGVDSTVLPPEDVVSLTFYPYGRVGFVLGQLQDWRFGIVLTQHSTCGSVGQPFAPTGLTPNGRPIRPPPPPIGPEFRQD